MLFLWRNLSVNAAKMQDFELDMIQVIIQNNSRTTLEKLH